MVTLLSEREAPPPARTPLLFDNQVSREDKGAEITQLNEMARMASQIDQAHLWARIENWTAHRWGERTVEWLIEGTGEWVPRLRPVISFDEVQEWRGDWQAVTLAASPRGGLCLPGEGPYRIVATVGDTADPPVEVVEALRRLAFYVAGTWDHPGGMTRDGETARPASWPARALHYSGAADLLRRYR